MPDAPTAPQAPEPSGTPGGMRGFFERETAGLPNWVWLVVIGAGLVAAYFIPRVLGSKSSPTSATDPNQSNPWIDPSTGLPYGDPYGFSLGVNGDGAIANNGNTGGVVSGTTPTTFPVPRFLGPPVPKTFDGTIGQGVTGSHWFTVPHAPVAGSTLPSIAALTGTPLGRLVALNPGLTPDGLYPGRQVRYL